VPDQVPGTQYSVPNPKARQRFSRTGRLQDQTQNQSHFVNRRLSQVSPASQNKTPRFVFESRRFHAR